MTVASVCGEGDIAGVKEQEETQKETWRRTAKQLRERIIPCLAIKRRFPLKTHRTLG